MSNIATSHRPPGLNEKNGTNMINNGGENVDLFGTENIRDVYPGVETGGWVQGESADKIDWLELVGNEDFKRHLKTGEHMKVYRKKKGFKQFRRLILAQELRPFGNEFQDSSSSNEKGTATEPMKNGGAVWCIRFSHDGKFMATAGKDEILRIWKVISSPAERLELNQHSISFWKSTANAISQLNGQLAQYGGDTDSASLNSGSSNTHVDSLGSSNANRDGFSTKAVPQEQQGQTQGHRHPYGLGDSYCGVFHPNPLVTFHEHTDDILDIDWSKNSFILTGSMDKSCKLWHCARPTSLKTFVHSDFVTAVRFHPEDDRFFLSACLDQKCRLWSILEKQVIFEYDCGDLITAMDISYDGNYTILGTFNGYIHVLITKSLELLFSFNVLDKDSELKKCHRTSRRLKKQSSDKAKNGPKITGLEFIQKDARNYKISSKDVSDWFLVSSNDSRIRIYTLNQEFVSVMKGHSNEHSQITAHSTVTRSGKAYVVSGSEDHWIYCWKLSDEVVKSTETSSKDSKSTRSRSGSLRSFCRRRNNDSVASETLDAVLSRGYTKNHQVSSNSNYIGFHAHHHPITCATAVPMQVTKVLSLSNDLICELTMQFWETTDDFTMESASKNARAKKNGNAISSNDGQKTDCRRKISIDKTIPNVKGKSGVSGAQSNNVPNIQISDGDNRTTNAVNGTTAANPPSLIEFIGGIVVSADTTGVIRVFRSDISSNVRKKVLNRLNAIEKQLKENGEGSVKPRTSGVSSVAAATNGSLSTATTFVGNGSNGHNVHSIERPTPFPMQDSLPLVDESSSSLTTLQQQQPHSQSRVCNVCGGTRFATDQTLSFNQAPQNVKYYCLDCGALYTSLR